MSLRLCVCLYVSRDHVGSCRGPCSRRARVSLRSVRPISEEQRMSIDHVLAVVPVADFEAAHAWYERLFGRPADNLPMEGLLVEWRVTDSGWVQVTRNADRAGSALVNFAVDDLDQHVADVSGRGLAPGAIETVNKGVQLSAIRDPEGNTITFIGDFRVEY